ncbi:MAG TPA: MBL fold metallo-hydrolase [Pseudonocardiaceae bacterium]|nr:MBL fold metallo-hydrolase [Pseudonocardiaceae bacterium]
MDVTADDPTADWTSPGVFEVVPGIHRIPLPLPNDGLRAVNVYAIAAGDRLVMIDSGWAIEAAREQLAAALAALGAGFGDVERFLVTHVHLDHYTQAVALRREFGMPIALGKNEQPTLNVISRDRTDESGSPFEERLRAAGAESLLARLAAAGRRPVDPSIWEMPDDWLTDRDNLQVGDRQLEAIATPGHTRGHLVFRDDAASLLFAGDHVLPHITPSIGFEGAPVDFPLRDYLDSLRLVRALPDTRLLPAHGPVAGSTHARVDALLEHHDHRLEIIYGMVERGATTANEAAGLMTWTRRERTLAELGLFNEMLAVLETMSHLDVLVLQGRLVVTVVDGTKRYAVAA